MASFASVFGKGKGKADDAKQDDKKASSPTPKPVKPVVLTHCRPHATMPVLEVNLYKKDFADAEALNQFGSLRKVDGHAGLREHILQARREQYPPSAEAQGGGGSSSDSPAKSPFGTIKGSQELNYCFIWDVPMTSPAAARFAFKQLENEVLALETVKGIKYELAIDENAFIENLKKVVDCKIIYVVTSESITLQNGEALHQWLVNNDYESEDGGYYRLLLNESNMETFMNDLKAQCDKLELDCEEFEPTAIDALDNDTSTTPPQKKRRTATFQSHSS